MDMFWSWLSTHWLTILSIVVVSFLVGRFGDMVISLFIRRFVGRLHTDLTDDDATKRQDTLISLLQTLLKVVVWTVALFMLLRIFGIDLAPLLAGASVLGVALGFGAQSVIKDFLSGLFIILENQYRVGDVVDLEGSAGTVEHITVRSTVIRDADGNVHYIPNGNIMRVINKTMGFSTINLTIAVKPSTNIDRLAEIINNIGETMLEDPAWKDKLLEAPRFLSIGNFSDTALEVKITGKTQPSKQWGVTGELRRRLLSALKKHKIELAQLPASAATGTVRKA